MLNKIKKTRTTLYLGF